MTEEVSSKLSLLTRKLAEVGQLKGEIADKLFEEADAGIITKEQALEILDVPENFEEAIDQLYGFVKKNRIIGCVYDW